jgi:hypothetical protein
MVVGFMVRFVVVHATDEVMFLRWLIVGMCADI